MRAFLQWLKQILLARVSVLTDQVRGLDGATRERAGWLCILGRENYTEIRKSYPTTSDDELIRIVKLELQDDKSGRVFWSLGPSVEQYRNVVFYRVLDGVSLPEESLVHVPESLLATALLAPNQLGIIRRSSHEFFFAAGSPGAVRAGFLQTPERYGMAVGREFSDEPLIIDQGMVGDQILSALRRQSRRFWLDFINRRRIDGIAQSFAAGAAGFATLGLLYLLLSSAYLITHTRVVESRLADLGPKVVELGVKQRELGRLQTEVSNITSALASRESTYQQWRFVKLLMDEGASITQMQFADTRLTLRGLAPSATTVLGAIAKAPGVEGARFSSPVRQAGEQEEFAVEISLAASAQGRRP